MKNISKVRSQVMVRAWQIAKEASEKFGHKAVEFLGQSLKLAWSEIKSLAKKANKGASNVSEIQRPKNIVESIAEVNLEILGDIITIINEAFSNEKFAISEKSVHSDGSLTSHVHYDTIEGYGFSDVSVTENSLGELDYIYYDHAQEGENTLSGTFFKKGLLNSIRNK